MVDTLKIQPPFTQRILNRNVWYFFRCYTTTTTTTTEVNLFFSQKKENLEFQEEEKTFIFLNNERSKIKIVNWIIKPNLTKN